MTLVLTHIDRCRHDRPVMFATIGVRFYGMLTLATLAYSALSAVWH